MQRSLHASLRALGTDYIDIYHVHEPPAGSTLGDDLFEALGLFVIGKDGEDMAADILVYHDDGCVQAWSAGVKDGDTAYVKAGALAALYYFRAQHLLAKKHSRCDVGLSRPFLKDGVLQYKNKWGLELTSHNDKLFVLKFSQDSAGTRAFMRNNPFIYLDGQRLQGAVFRDPEKSDDTATLERLRKDYHISGMAGLRFFD